MQQRLEAKLEQKGDGKAAADSTRIVLHPAYRDTRLMPGELADHRRASALCCCVLLTLSAAAVCHPSSRPRAGLDPSKHFTEQHLISLLGPSENKTIDDIKTATVETYESLGDVFALYRTLATGKQKQNL